MDQPRSTITVTGKSALYSWPNKICIYFRSSFAARTIEDAQKQAADAAENFRVAVNRVIAKKGNVCRDRRKKEKEENKAVEPVVGQTARDDDCDSLIQLDVFSRQKFRYYVSAGKKEPPPEYEAGTVFLLTLTAPVSAVQTGENVFGDTVDTVTRLAAKNRFTVDGAPFAFTHDLKLSLKDRLMDLAAKDARHQADVLARGLGIVVKRPLQVTPDNWNDHFQWMDEGNSYGRRSMARRSAAPSAAAPAPRAPQADDEDDEAAPAAFDQDISAALATDLPKMSQTFSVNVTFEI